MAYKLPWIKDLAQGTTKEDLVKACPELDNITFDYALPQHWVNVMATDFTMGNKAIIGSSFVWRYADGDGPMGIPFAITKDGQDILIRYKQRNYRIATGQI